MKSEDKEFEFQCARLLELGGFRVAPEKIVGHKKIDLYAEGFELGKRRRYAVECKDWRTPLTLKQLHKIAVDYVELYEQNLVDMVLLVTRSGLSPAAQTYADSSRVIVHLTLQSLQNWLMDFDLYLESIINDYKEAGLHHYYVPPQTFEGGERADLNALLGQWVCDHSQGPIALLGGYGSGKTTFALRLAYDLAVEYKAQRVGRIPILIRLGELCTEQTIDGLLGRLFASRYVVRGYSFGLFQELNRSGSFLIILDGFDEMKYSMSAGVFRYTFKELLKLVTGTSKVVLSGRPTAFLADAERLEFLHALIDRGGQQVLIRGRPRFRELTLAPFGKDQILSFIRRYQEYLRNEKGYDQVPSESDFTQSSTLMELASRPVHLQMLFEVLPGYQEDLSKLSVQELYMYFLDLLVHREAEKPARQRFSGEQRRDFLRAIAFYMWMKSTPKLSLDEIPIAEFCEAIGLTLTSDPDEIRRDLTAGSFLEVGYPEQVHFPHRSIQEYLLAEFLLGYLREDEIAQKFAKAMDVALSFPFFDDRVSPEVVDFMIASIGDKDRALLLRHLGGVHRPLTSNIVRLWTSSSSFWPELLTRTQNGETWPFALLVAGFTEGSWSLERAARRDVCMAGVEMLQPDNKKDQDFIYQAFYLTWIFVSADPDCSMQESGMCAALAAIYRFYHSTWSPSLKKMKHYRPSFIQRMLGQVMYEPLSRKVFLLDLGSALRRTTRQIGLSSWYFQERQRLSGLTTFNADERLHQILGPGKGELKTS
jgi:NACHT domain-containing protein/restriction endonuclease